MAPSRIDLVALEWLLEETFVIIENGGASIKITEYGTRLLSELDAGLRADMETITIMATAQATKLVEDLVAEIKRETPGYGHLDRCYVTAGRILRRFLGLPWLQTHVMSTAAPTEFFQNDWSSDIRRKVHMTRVIHLAEMFLNLHQIEGFQDIVERMNRGNCPASAPVRQIG
jgi:hypothetical protein